VRPLAWAAHTPPDGHAHSACKDSPRKARFAKGVDSDCPFSPFSCLTISPSAMHLGCRHRFRSFGIAFVGPVLLHRAPTAAMATGCWRGRGDAVQDSGGGIYMADGSVTFREGSTISGTKAVRRMPIRHMRLRLGRQRLSQRSRLVLQ
jgi:hypothetical protein